MPLGRWGFYVAVVLIMSLITWIFFYLQDMPLDPSDNTFVVTAWALIIWLVWSSVSLFRKLTWPQRVLVAGVGMAVTAVLAAGMYSLRAGGKSAPQPPVTQSPAPPASRRRPRRNHSHP